VFIINTRELITIKKDNACKYFFTQVQSSQPPKATPWTKTHHMTYRLLRLVHLFFAQPTFLPIPQNHMLYNAFQLARHPKSATFYGGI